MVEEKVSRSARVCNASQSRVKLYLFVSLLAGVDRDSVHTAIEDGERHDGALRSENGEMDRQLGSSKFSVKVYTPRCRMHPLVGASKVHTCQDVSSRAGATELRTGRLTFGVDDHLVQSRFPVLFELFRLVSHLGDLGDVFDVGAVRSGSKDASAESVPAFVRRRHEGSARVVDESRAADVDVFAVESVLQELDNVLTDRVRAFETLKERENTSRNWGDGHGGGGERRLTLVQLMRVPAARAVWSTGNEKVKPRWSFSSSEASVPISVRKWSTDPAM